jgi:hypothetical protein
MNAKSRTSHRLAATFFAATVVGGLAAASPAAATSHSAKDGACSFDSASLPRTADAAQGWYDQCRAQQPFFTTKASLPMTADTAEGWYVQRKTGERLARTGQLDSPPMTDARQDYTSWLTNPLAAPGAETTETPTAGPPANWRRVMNEVPTADSPANWRRLTNEVPQSP